jgi:hypothetical protein
MNYKALIVITTCNRLLFLKLFSPDYIMFCSNNPNYDFLVSLDGNDQAYIEFCKGNGIKIIYSSEREGVGLAKNRVLSQFPNYDYYFFIDDDVELINDKVFDIHIEVSQKSNISHLSLGEKFRFFPELSKTIIGNYTISHFNYGSGVFNFFTKEGLDKVGGWHTEFAKYKRYGHTEHSWRFKNQNICPAPFNLIEELSEGYLRYYNPSHVTDINQIVSNSGLALIEEEIIKLKLSSFQLQTISEFFCLNSESHHKIDYSNTYTNNTIIEKIKRNPFLSNDEKIDILTNNDLFYFSNDDTQTMLRQIQAMEIYNKQLLDLNISLQNTIKDIKNTITYKFASILSKWYRFLYRY